MKLKFDFELDMPAWIMDDHEDTVRMLAKLDGVSVEEMRALNLLFVLARYSDEVD